MSASGSSTSSVQKVAARLGRATSLAPRYAASLGFAPSPRCRWVFSSTTMARSTSGPMARAKPARVITLIVCPAADRQATAPRMATGMVMTAIIVIRHSPRNSRMTSEHRTAPRTPSSVRLRIALSTYTDWSITSFRSTSGVVSRSFMSGRLAFRLPTTPSVLAPCWR